MALIMGGLGSTVCQGLSPEGSWVGLGLQDRAEDWSVHGRAGEKVPAIQ